MCLTAGKRNNGPALGVKTRVSLKCTQCAIPAINWTEEGYDGDPEEFLLVTARGGGPARIYLDVETDSQRRL